MKRSSSFPLFACVLTAACDTPDYRTDQGQLGLLIAELNGHIVQQRPETTVHAVTGTQICVGFGGWFEPDGRTYHVRSDHPDDTWLRECFDPTAGAGAHVDESGCLVLDEPGATALELASRSCETTAEDDGPTFTADRLPVIAYATGDLALQYDDPVARIIYDALDPGPAGAFAPRPAVVGGAPLPVLADGRFTVFLQPVLATDPTRTVAFSSGTAVVVADPAPESFTPMDDGSATIELAIDQRARVALELASGTLTGEELVGVDPSAATGMEIIVGYERCAACEDGYGVPSYALAVVRDDAGARLFGARVDWTLDGDGELSTDGQVLGDAIGFERQCGEDDVGERKTGTLRASYGDLAATAAIAYVCPEADAANEWDVEVVDDDAEPLDIGCVCTASPRGAPVASLAFVALAMLARRRRK